MKKFLIGLFLAPLFVSAMGNPFRRSYLVNPYPIGVNEDCTHKYEGKGYGSPNLFGNTFDTTCLYIAKSIVAEVGPDCSYDDYKPSEGYKKDQTRMMTEQQFLRLNKETILTMKYGAPQVQQFKEFCNWPAFGGQLFSLFS